MSEIPVSKIPLLIEKLFTVPRAFRTALLFLGPPGIGKTASVAAAAARLASKMNRVLIDTTCEAEPYAEGIEYVCTAGSKELLSAYERVRAKPEKHFVFVRIVAPHITPEDLHYPRMVDGAVANMAPLMLAMLTIPGVAGILFIDEITNVVDPGTKAALFALVNEGRIGLAGSLARDVVVVAAGNKPEESSMVYGGLPSPLINRFAVFRVSHPDAMSVIEFIERYVRDPHPAVVAYLASNPGDVYLKPKEPEGFEEVQFPSPRQWTKLAAILRHVDIEIGREFALAMLGPEVGPRFVAWLELNPPKPKDVLEKPSVLEEVSHEARYLSIVLTARYVVEEGYGVAEKAARLLAWLVKKGYEELSMLLLHIVSTRDKKLLLEIVNGLRRVDKQAYNELRDVIARSIMVEDEISNIVVRV